MVSAHQIWSCYVTQDAKFEILPVLILHLMLEKDTKFAEESYLHQKLSAKSLTGGGGGGVENTLTVPLGLTLSC